MIPACVDQVVAGILFVANATSLGWALRGEWGHWWGATVPGVLCGMSLWLAFGETADPWQMLAYGAALAVSLSLGGVLSYGLLLGYATAEPGRDTRSPLYGLLGVFLVGGLWGFFGGASLGILLTELEYTLTDLALWAVLASLGAFLSYKLLVVGLNLHLSPPRSDVWAALLGAALFSTAYFGLGAKDYTVLVNAYAGWAGFGGGFALGALIHHRGEKGGLRFSSWKFMEHSPGFLGGLSLAISSLLSGGSLPSISLQGSAARLCVTSMLWFSTYMVVSNMVEHWTFELRRLPRMAFPGFQILALICLGVFIALAEGLLDGGKGMPGQSILFILLLTLFTALGTAKFMRRWSDVRSAVVRALLLQFAVCLGLLVLLL